MNATEILRHMLNERGVEYRTHGMTDRTWFEVGNISWFIIESEDGSLTANAVYLTPEQAIAATLGVEPDEAAMVKLHDRMNAALLEYERAQGIEKRDGDGGVVVPFVAEMHSLLEEAAALGSSNCTNGCTNSERTGTCHMVLREDIRGHAYQDIYECSECGEEVVRETCMNESEPPNFCPNCGKVVEHTTNDVDAEVAE